MDFSQILEATRSDNIWSVVVRFGIWLAIVLIFCAGLDAGKSYRKIKSAVGWFMFALLTIAILSILIFGFIPTF